MADAGGLSVEMSIPCQMFLPKVRAIAGGCQGVPGVPDCTNHERVPQLLRAVTSVVWFRRDLRLDDNPALTAALAEAGEVVPLFVRDPGLAGDNAGPSRRMDRLDATLVDNDQRHSSLGGPMIIRT